MTLAGVNSTRSDGLAGCGLAPSGEQNQGILRQFVASISRTDSWRHDSQSVGTVNALSSSQSRSLRASETQKDNSSRKQNHVHFKNTRMHTSACCRILDCIDCGRRSRMAVKPKFQLWSLRRLFEQFKFRLPTVGLIQWIFEQLRLWSSINSARLRLQFTWG